MRNERKVEPACIPYVGRSRYITMRRVSLEAAGEHPFSTKE